LNLEHGKSITTPHKIKVLLVDDSPLVLAVLKRILLPSPVIEVVGTARHGKEAMELIPRLQPQVVCTDLHMPVMNGLQLTREIMAKDPRPILVLSVSVEEGSNNVFKLLEAGAVDVYSKPHGGVDGLSPEFANKLVRKIRIVAGVRAIRRTTRTKAARPPEAPPPMSAVDWENPVSIVVIGASTGGPQALQTILSKLPANFPIPVVCVQHIAEGFLQGLVEWLAPQCSLHVTMAAAGEIPTQGNIYFAPEGTHLRLDDKGAFVTAVEPSFDSHRPSVTIAMQSAARAYGKGTAGILLTGMGDDGALGMRAIAEAGGLTIAQDESTCAVFGMPRQAIELGAARQVLSPTGIAEVLKRGLHNRREPRTASGGSFQ